MQKNGNEVRMKINLPKYAEFKINNIVATGSFGFRKFLNFNEINKLIEKSKFGWDIINQETTPQLCTYIVREDKSSLYVQLWHTGRFYMAGVKSEKEVKIYFKELLKEMRKLVPRVFKKNDKKKMR